ncbi:substrate-binding domain-containing protein [Magnetococcales bacterium HHB-1]
MSEVAQAFEKKTGIRTQLFGGGATRGIRAVAAKSFPLGGSCRDRLSDGNGGAVLEERSARLVHVAWDALVVITHTSNRLMNISMEDLKAIFEGRILSWKALGGPDKRIVLVTREGKISGVGHMFRRMVFNDPEFTFKARSLKVQSTGQVEKSIQSLTEPSQWNHLPWFRFFGIEIDR